MLGGNLGSLLYGDVSVLLFTRFVQKIRRLFLKCNFPRNGVGENRNWLNNSMFNTVFSNICSPYTEQTPSGLPNPTPVEGHAVRFFQATGMSSRAVVCTFNSCHSTSCHFKIM